jgi:hypothetical protein
MAAPETDGLDDKTTSSESSNETSQTGEIASDLSDQEPEVTLPEQLDNETIEAVLQQNNEQIAQNNKLLEENNKIIESLKASSPELITPDEKLIQSDTRAYAIVSGVVIGAYTGIAAGADIAGLSTMACVALAAVNNSARGMITRKEVALATELKQTTYPKREKELTERVKTCEKIRKASAVLESILVGATPGFAFTGLFSRIAMGGQGIGFDMPSIFTNHGHGINGQPLPTENSNLPPSLGLDNEASNLTTPETFPENRFFPNGGNVLHLDTPMNGTVADFDPTNFGDTPIGQIDANAFPHGQYGKVLNIFQDLTNEISKTSPDVLNNLSDETVHRIIQDVVVHSGQEVTIDDFIRAGSHIPNRTDVSVDAWEKALAALKQ